MTQKEIAEEAGVAVSTVSRILSSKGPSAASKEVQDRVWEIVRRTGYTPNSHARNLRSGGETSGQAVRTIACVFARWPANPTDPFFSGISRSIESEAYQENYFLRYSYTTHDITALVDGDGSADARPRGLVVLGRCDQRLFQTLRGKIRNVVYAGLNPTDAKCDEILCDGFIASCTAVNHLASLGHRQIGYIGETTNEVRFDGYRETLKKQGLPFSDALTENRILSCEGGYSGLLLLLKRAPETTAVFCSNDQTAIGAMKAATQLNLRIPQDLSIISIDDIEAAQFLSPSLTTVHIPTDEIGKVAAKVLIDRIKGGHSANLKISLPSYLVERESCGKPRRTALNLP